MKYTAWVKCKTPGIKGIKKELLYGGSGLWLGGLMEDLREQSFTLDKALSGSMDNS